MINHHTNNLTIAVTGHRFIPNDVRLYQSIQEIINSLIDSYQDHTFTLICPLAEGSDQLVARIALDLREFKLHVPLPMPVEEYLQDFTSEDGQETFQQLLSVAAKIHQLPPKKSHPEAYRALGQYLIHNSDLLFAVWNGVFTKQAGGTSDVVRMAVEAGKTIYWVYCPNQKLGQANNLEEQKQIGDLEILSP